MARILVADDAPAVLDVLDDILTLEGHRVVRATSGQDALRKVEETAPDLAVLDIMMPDMDGMVVLDAIRRAGEFPVILITGLIGETLAKKVAHHRVPSRRARAGSLRRSGERDAGPESGSLMSPREQDVQA